MNVTRISPDWQTLQGTTLDGGYELKEIVEATEERAVLRVRVLGDYTLKASAIFYALENAVAEEQIGIWQSIRFFESKSAVTVPLGTGKLRVDNAIVAYVVYQTADETLADALAVQALTPDQTIDSTRAVARGLSELHANGYVHGDLGPAEIRAVGDRVEISTESIRRANTAPLTEYSVPRYRAPESDGRNTTIASDVWCLGATIFEALTQTPYEPGLHEKAAALRHPFGTLLEGCLGPDPDKRLKLGDFESILRSKTPPPKPRPVEAVPVGAPKASAAQGMSNGTGASATAAEPIVKTGAPATRPDREVKNDAPRPVLPNEPSGRVASGTPPEPPKEAPTFRPTRLEIRQEASAQEPGTSFSARRGWLYAGAAFLTIFAILWFVHAHNSQPPAPAPSQPTGTKTGQKPDAWPTTTLTPDTKSSAPASQPVQPAPKANKSSPAQTGQRTVWRVVLYTYVREADAQKRASEIVSKRPDLHAEVFSPVASGPYLVVAGDGTTRDEATRIRLRAIREGMPHDSYIQNYSH